MKILINRDTIRPNPLFGQKRKYVQNVTFVRETVVFKIDYGWCKQEWVNGELSSEAKIYGVLESPKSWVCDKYEETRPVLIEEDEPEYIYYYSWDNYDYLKYDDIEFETIEEALG